MLHAYGHTCRDESLRTRTVSRLVRHVVRIRMETARLRRHCLVVSMCTIYDMHRHLLYMWFTMLCIHILDDTCCMIHACSLYLYGVRFVTCQMVYLTHSWVNIFRFRNIEDGAMWLSWGKVNSSAV